MYSPVSNVFTQRLTSGIGCCLRPGIGGAARRQVFFSGGEEAAKSHGVTRSSRDDTWELMTPKAWRTVEWKMVDILLLLLDF